MRVKQLYWGAFSLGGTLEGVSLRREDAVAYALDVLVDGVVRPVWITWRVGECGPQRSRER